MSVFARVTSSGVLTDLRSLGHTKVRRIGIWIFIMRYSMRTLKLTCVLSKKKMQIIIFNIDIIVNVLFVKHFDLKLVYKIFNVEKVYIEVPK